MDTMETSTDTLEVFVRPGETTAIVAIITMMAVIIALGSVGNILVTLAVIQTKKLQTVSNMFVANLSICDLMFVSVVLPVNMYTYVFNGWQFNMDICRFIGFLGYTLTGTTIMTITLIAWNRYKLVVNVSRYKKLFRPRNMAIMLAATWIVPIIFLQPAIFGAWGQFGYIPMLSSCNLGLDNSSQTFKIFLLIVRAAIPCGLIIYYYTAIYVTTRASHQRLRHMASTSNTLFRHNNHRREMRLTRMMIAIFVVFVLSYFPCTISSVIDWSKMLSKTFHMFCQTSVFLGSAINPLLYGFMNDQFRKAYYQILTCRMVFRRSKRNKLNGPLSTDQEKTEVKCAALAYQVLEVDKLCMLPDRSDSPAMHGQWENSEDNVENWPGSTTTTCTSNMSTKSLQLCNENQLYPIENTSLKDGAQQTVN
ncbi:G-protein coupled receptor moody-like [Physella acuta]|uniref:G-protein coupled receptor moody-like n=1 Tax=Physella acuta TaxID=109671 RepID=UPI0027DBA300|nr:G-protein coupled receptor moody-like [Physella acuta]